jgi:hypothetical protein
MAFLAAAVLADLSAVLAHDSWAATWASNDVNAISRPDHNENQHSRQHRQTDNHQGHIAGKPGFSHRNLPNPETALTIIQIMPKTANDDKLSITSENATTGANSEKSPISCGNKSVISSVEQLVPSEFGGGY